MPTGVSTLYRPRQPEPSCPLVSDDSYFIIRLHDTQAFFPAGPLAQVHHLLLGTSIDCSFLSGDPLQSLHKLTTCRKNIPCRPGVQVNLTDWLPARETDTVKIMLEYTVLQDAPIQSLVNKMEQLGLVAKASLIRPEIGVATKVAQVAGKLLSVLVEEGKKTNVFTLPLDLNLAQLQAGYYAVVGSQTDEIWPKTLEIDTQGRLADASARELTRLSYAVIQVQVIKRRGREMLRNENWWEMLEIARSEILSTSYERESERQRAFQGWQSSIKHIRLLAQKDQSSLLSEIDDVIASAHLQVEHKLFQHDLVPEANQLAAYPHAWETLLGVRTPQELQARVALYQEKLQESEYLLQQYQRQDG